MRALRSYLIEQAMKECARVYGDGGETFKDYKAHLAGLSDAEIREELETLKKEEPLL